jgi:putative membrane protein
MKIEWVSYFFFFIAALVHIYIFVLETFLFQKENGYKAFKMKKEDHEAVKPWALNQGFYNLFLAVGMFMGLYYVNQLEIKVAGAMVSFVGFSMVAAGLVLFVTNKKMRKGALVQMVPPLLGFFFLAFHIIEKIKGAGN